MGIAGNKCDKFEEEDIDKKIVEEFANEVGASFQLTSAQSNIGIKDLFIELGQKFLDSSNPNIVRKKSSKLVKGKSNPNKNSKNSCC